MDKLLIRGGRRLQGEVTISGAKNAAVPILCAGLLTSETVVLDNLPRLRDIDTTLRLLERLGVRHSNGGKAHTERAASRVDRLDAASGLVKTRRASIL